MIGAKEPMASNSPAENAASTRPLTKVGLYRFSMAQFLVALVVLIITFPFTTDLKNGEAIENVLLLVVMVSAALAVSGRNAILGLVLVVPAICGPLLNIYWHGLVPLWVITATHVAFVAFIIYQLLRFVLRASRVNSQVMCAGIAGYLMLGLLWTPAYRMVSQFSPRAFTGAHLPADGILKRFDALYLSFTSLTCLGCNDIIPLSNAARMLLMLEAVTGVMYLAILIARLVALYTKSADD
jgi:hypothetical protein